METQEIESLLHQTAEEIRKYTASQVEAWQAIPYWTLESEGRSGWADHWGLPYKYGLLGVDKEWPHQLFVELSTGRLVCSMRDEVVDASDELVVATYARSTHVASLFDASARLAERVDRATNGKDDGVSTRRITTPSEPS